MSSGRSYLAGRRRCRTTSIARRQPWRSYPMRCRLINLQAESADTSRKRWNCSILPFSESSFLGVLDRAAEPRISKTMKTIVFTLIVIGSALATSSEGAEVELPLAPSDPAPRQTATFATQPTGIWQGEVGEGFRPGVQTLSLEAGGAGGVAAFGGRQAHDFALTSVSYGYMWGKVAGEGRGSAGNGKSAGELFGGLQVSPSRNWLVGLTPHLRYNFATGTRWIPFADLGAGVCATDIGPPDA